MIVKMLSTLACSSGTYLAGQLADLPDETAAELIRNGYALEPVTEPKPEQETESTTVETTEAPIGNEKADAPPATPRKRRIV